MNAHSPMDALRRGLSPAKLALLEQRLRGNAAKRGDGPAIPRLALRDAPLSYGQERLWFLWNLDPAGSRYNLGFRLRIRGDLDASALRRSLEAIVGRHEVLRTAFVAVEGEPRQRIAAAGPLALPHASLQALPAAEREAALESLARETAGQPFDLAAGPLLRARLVELGPQDHALLLVLHHSVSDAWSLGVLVREFAALYPAYQAGRTPVLPELPVQYADYAVWQRQRQQGETLERSLAYWRERLAGAPAVLALPGDAAPAAASDDAGAVYALDLPAELLVGLNRLSRRHDATLFMTLAAAFNVLLYRHSGQSDLCIGYPAANRPLAELEGLIGFFLNTLVLRTDLSGNPRFSELLAQVRQHALGAQAHQELPFEKLVEALQPAREAGRNPLFQVMLVLQNAYSGRLELPGLQVDAEELELPVAKFDLTLSLTERAGGLRAAFEYRTALFRESAVARLARHWRRLLESLVADPEARLSQLALLTEAEARQLADWNATAAPLPPEDYLHSRFEAQAHRTPDAVAVAHSGRHLSYRRLNQQANRLAHALRRRGVRPDDRVGLCLEAGANMVIGLLGILKAGGAYVPLDPSYPAERLADILSDCGAALAVTEPAQRDALSAAGVTPLCLERDRAELDAQPDRDPVPAGHPDNAAYLIYTSGSTGRPKGVVVSHRNAVHSTAARERHYPEAVRGYLLLSSYAFDSSVAGLFWTLSQGGKLCLPDAALKQDPPALARLIAGEGLSHLLCLPAFYGLLLEQAEPGCLATLNTVIVAGEACPPAVAARHRERLPQARLHNEYGPTEGTVWCSVHTVQAEDGQSSSVPIGRPIANAQIHLLDAHLNPVPVGVAGELHLGGAGLSRGYHERPDLTAERYIPDPYGPAGSRLYKTGDLARRREDGVLEFLGRLDGQVKIRGYRIEPGEIEARLLRHPALRAAAVLARQDGPGGARLVAYLVPRADQAAPDGGELKALLQAGLPDYMVPSAYVVLDRLPLTPNGKLDRNALPAPEPSARPSGRAAPQGEAETLLAKLWAETLGLPSVGRDDNFFELGGHSILAVQLAFKLRQAFATEASLRSLVECPTLAAQALLLTGASAPAACAAPDWEAEARLDPAIAPRCAAEPAVRAPQAVLLTGATGFLGAYLLRDLLSRTGAIVYCPVRGQSPRQASDRLRQVLKSYGMEAVAADPRVAVVCGDLALPSLGLSPERFERLSGKLDAIYHNGALVNFACSYEELKPANVQGTREVLRLACLGKPKAVHYVSTVSVFGENPPPRAGGFAEDDEPPANGKLTGGYAQSKWVAERLVRAAAARGLAVTIHRPAAVTGDSRSGVWNTGDFLCRVIKGCIQLRKAPRIDESLDWVPVDYVSAAIVFLSGRPEFIGRISHLTNPAAGSTAQLVASIRARGYPLEAVSLGEWAEYAARNVAADPEHVLYPLLPLLEGWRGGDDEADSAAGQYACAATLAMLAQGNIDRPTRPDALFTRYLSYLADCGFIPPPAGAAGDDREFEQRRLI